MDGLPSNIMFHIFSRIPGKSLARSRCVSKEWCKYIDDRYLMIVNDERVLEPIPILYHFHLSYDRKIHSLCFHVIESKRKEPRRYYKKARVGSTKPHTYVSELKEDSFLEFLPKKPLSESSYVEIKVRGSCNGLMCLSQYEDYALTSLVVVDPLRKECYKLPPPHMHVDRYMRVSCALGFDASTNTLKMVCVMHNNFSSACTLVHVFGTNTWREIPQVPSYPITGEVIFADGCLHWLVTNLDIKTEHDGRHIRWFDVEKEEFGLIDPPKRMCDIWRTCSCYSDYLVDLNGEVGFLCAGTMEVWVLKQKEWVPHYRFEEKRVPNGDIEVLGIKTGTF